ncbi:MAG: proton-conducting transporter membrane subunit [Planctomycetota bacterium]
MPLFVATLLPDAAPALSVGLCLLAIPLIGLFRRRPNLREGVSLLIATLNFALVFAIYLRHEAGQEIQFELLRVTDQLRLAFRVDDLGLIFALVASFLWILNTLYSIGYMRAHHEHKQTRFYACFAAAIAAAMGAAFASNLFALFVFYEALTLVTYPLVMHAETPEAKAGARRYLTYLLGLSIGFQLPALFLVSYLAGTLDFEPQGLLNVHAAGASAGILGLTFVLFLVGVAKAALMPFHAWLPAAMVAPTPVSALLHAVAVVKMGVFTMSRVVFHVFGVDLLARLGLNDILVWAACFTIITASLIALGQDNLKRRLAFSTVSQLSYILLGIGLLVPMAATGGLVHIGMHAASKITLFFCAGAIMVASHKTEVSQLDGIGRRMPFTMVAFTIGAFSMIGLPFTAGMVSKWWLVGGAGEGGYGWVLAVFVVSTMLNAAYYLPIVWRAFFRPSPEGERGLREAPLACVLALSATALLTVGLFFQPDVLLDLARGVVHLARSAP